MKRASLNHAYRLVWNDRINAFVAVAENVASRGKRSSRAVLLGSLLALGGSALGTGSAYALPPGELPTGGQVVAGQGSIAQAGNAMVVTQNTSKMIANWQTFNVGANASVNFIQPNASATVLNRVLSADPSMILGNITANGRVFLVNPSGVIFGSSARVDAAGLVASTLNLSNADFMDGKYRFAAQPGAGAVQNFGEIAVRDGGFVSLVGATVNNAGKLVASGGQVALAAGQNVRLDITESGLLGVEVDGGVAGAQVSNSGHIAADGGRVWMTARQAGEMIGTAINQSGTVRANAVNERDGEIWLDGGAGEVVLGGSVQARGAEAGEQGGKVVATGGVVRVTGEVDVSGASGGGEVYLGGGWQGKDPAIAEAGRTFIQSGASIKADATVNGDGGTVVAWSSDLTRHDGAISARGAGNGSGGQVETSSRGALGVSGAVDVGAASGKGGQWLLDPDSIVVVAASGAPLAGVGSPDTYTANTGAGNAEVLASSINATLSGGGDVTLLATNNITVNTDISKSGDAGGDGSTLIFNAGNNITLSTGANISSTVGKLNVDFGTVANGGTGTVTINGTVASNGGNVNFYKDTVLGNATPVSTTPNTPVAAGDIVFHRDVALAAPSYSVTLDSTGAFNGSTYTSAGGKIEFKGSISSGTPTAQAQWSQALILDSSGDPPGAIILGDAAGDSVGGTGNAALRSLTLTGPSSITLNAGTMNFMNTSGNVLIASSTLGVPKLILNATDTVINVKGGTRASETGYADYAQETFDIVAADTGNRTLTVNADRSIKIKNRSIDGTTLASGAARTGTLQVTLNPFEAVAATGGAVILDGATIKTGGADVNIGFPTATPTDYAVGFGGDADGVTDGVMIKNTVIRSAGGDITIRGQAPITSAAGAGVKISGALTDIDAGAGDIAITGLVTTQTSAGTKDAVIIGEGGAARVTLQTTSGAIDVVGDASAVGTNPTGGSRYDGVILSSKALVKTDSGDINLTGTGGGGDQVFISENHGIKFEDTDTAVISNSGNITLTGTSGGKTSLTQGENSYGIYARGNTMYLGSAAALPAGGSAVNATGIITLIADSMELVNSNSFHLYAASSNELRIQPLTASRNIRFDSTPAVDALVLGNDWFNGGSNAIFQPGFGSGAGYGTAASGVTGAVTIGRADGSGLVSVAAATTFRDNTTILTDTGNVAVNADLVVQGLGAAPGNARTLTLATGGSVAATGAITADQLLIVNSGTNKDVALTGNNRINTLAADLDGRLLVNNAQAMTVGQITGSEARDTVRQATGIDSNGNDVTLNLSGGDLTIAQSIVATDATVGLTASAGRVVETGAAGSAGPTVVADKLYVSSQNTSVLDNQHAVDVLAGNISDQGLIFRNTKALEIGTVTLTPLTANADGTVMAAATVDKTGLSATNATNGKVYLRLTDGDLTQTQDVKVGSLFAELTTGAVTLERTTNEIATLAAKLDGAGKAISVKNKTAMTVDTVAVSETVGADGHSYTHDGIVTNLGDVSLAASADAGSLTGDLALKQQVNTGASSTLTSTTVRLSSGKGAVNETAATGIVTADKLAVQAVNSSTLDSNNVVNTLAAEITGTNQNLVFRNTKALDIGSVTLLAGGPLNGVTASTGTVTFNIDAGDLTQTQDLNADKLLTNMATGSVILTRTTNEVGTVAARLLGLGESFSLYDISGLTVGTANSVSGIVTNKGDVNLQAAADATSTTGGIVVTQAISTSPASPSDAADGTVRLVSNIGTVTDTGAGVITAGKLLAVAETGVVLDNANNDVAVLAGRVTGTGVFEYSDKNTLEVGQLTDLAAANVNGVQTNDGNLRISASKLDDSNPGDLNLTQSVVAGGTGSTLHLEAIRGKITETDNVSLSATNALIIARDTTTLENASGGVPTGEHTIGTLAANITGTAANFGFRNEGALTIGAVTGQETNASPALTAVNGVTTNDGHIQVATKAGSLTVEQNVTAGGNGTVDLRAGGAASDLNINDSATVRSVSGLSAGAGTIQLAAGNSIKTNTPNAVGTEISTTGNVLLQAGGGVGEDLYRIELAEAAKLAVQAGTATAGDGVWLHKTGADDLEVGTVAAINTATSLGGSAPTKDFGVAVADRSGIVTQANNGKINLNVANGKLIVTQNVTAHGSGSVDLRTGGTSKAIAIDGATVGSTSGQVQLIASGDISTTTDNGTTDEIATSGNVLLQAGGAIGADGKRIETNGVNTLAARSAGAQWLRQRVGDLTVGAVTALTPGDNGLDGITAVDRAGLVTTTNGSAINLAVSAGALTVTSDVQTAGNGSIDLRTGGVGKAVAINGASLKSGATGSGTGTVQVIASGDITTNTTNGTTDEILTAGNVLLQSGGSIGADGQRIETNGVAKLAAESAGDQWLRQRVGNLTVGAVTALAPTDNATVGVAASDKAGLVTTAGDGSVSLNVTAGSLTVESDVQTAGNGNIDLRTGGSAKAVAINGATLKSGATGTGTGTVQVIASGNITTNTANGVTNEIETAGNVLLESTGGAIGAAGNRIETSGVNTLAVRSSGAQWLRQTLGALTVGEVSALTPGDNALDNEATTRGGLETTTAGSAINLAVSAGALTVTENVQTAGNGTIDLRTGGVGNDVAINGATVKSGATGTGTGTVQVIASGDITTNTANGTTNEIETAGKVLLQSGGAIGASGNRIETSGVTTLAAESAADQWLHQTAGDLTVGEVTALVPSDDATLGVTASTKEGLKTTANNGKIALTVAGGSLTVAKNVDANGSGTVDLRTGGSGKAIAINGATVKSGSGQVQLIASGDISTTTNNGSVNEIETTGNVLLQAGGAIGASGKRIETASVNTLAAESAGSQWLRQVTGDLVVGAVAALVPGDDGLAGVSASDKAGLVTTTADSSINLNVAAGSLTVVEDVQTAGNGAIDLRTGGSGKAVAVNGATLKSGATGTGTGTVQVIASGDITTNTVNGVSDEISTAGNVLLQSGGKIGTAANRIETSGVATLAAKAQTDVWLQQTSGHLALGAVNALIPSDNAIDNPASNLAGIVSQANGNIGVNVANGSLTLQNDISAGSGKLDLAAAGGINQTGGSIKAGAMRVNAGGNVDLRSTGNRVNVIAADVTNGAFLYYDAGSIRIGRVATDAGVTEGIDTDGRVWVRAGDDITLERSVVARAVGDEALVLAATGAFRNLAGKDAVQAANGRWLIYDDNPRLEDRLGGLKFNFRRLRTWYDDYPPAEVRENGNGYITTTIIIDPDQPIRATGGATLAPGAIGNESLSVAGYDAKSGMARSGTADSYTADALLKELRLVAADPFAAANGRSVEMGMPLLIAVNGMRPFSTSFSEFLSGAEFLGATLGDGSPLPDWLRVDGQRGVLIGRLPESQIEEFIVRLQLKKADGQSTSLQILVVPVVADPEEVAGL